MLFLLMQLGVWIRFAIQNVALVSQTQAVIRADDLTSTSKAASWLFMLSSVFGVIYAVYMKAPIVYAAASGFSVLCQGVILARLYGQRRSRTSVRHNGRFSRSEAPPVRVAVKPDLEAIRTQKPPKIAAIQGPSDKGPDTCSICSRRIDDPSAWTLCHLPHHLRASLTPSAEA